ncbi:indole-3-glycerol phosphate synthase TrpC [Bacillus daqingensis]|uniref:Indole-3-glycerol phosphate synthase n=1 Tax=Bacillus daqingensis TaxID=872396 RepID=A0ABV9NVA5_9BACI
MTILDTIVAKKHEEVKATVLPDRQIEGSKRSMSQSLVSGSLPLGVIAEVKKASPSKGLIAEHFDPEGTARDYEAAGARAVSVLTDRDFFQGANQYLTSIRSQTSLPVLRKDFIIDHLQIEEADLIGADAILLIAACLTEKELQEFSLHARERKMESLIEVHDEAELEKVLRACHPDMIGVNNRDLRTFHTDLGVSERLQPMIPEGTMFISESGIHTAADVKRLYEAGADGLLIGESLMKSKDRSAFLENLFGDLR